MNVTKPRLRAVRIAVAGAVMAVLLTVSGASPEANAVRLTSYASFGATATVIQVSATGPATEVRLATYQSPDADATAPSLLDRIAARSAALGVPAPAALPLLASAIGLALFGFARGRRPRA